MNNNADNKDMAKQKTTSFQPDTDILSILREQAEAQDRSLSWIINYHIRKSLVADGVLSEKKPKKPSK